MTADGCAIDVVAFSLAPLSLIAPFASLSIVYSAVLAHHGVLVDREGVSPRGAGAMALVIVGIVCASAFGPHDSRPHAVRELGRDAVQPRFLVFALCGLACIALREVFRFDRSSQSPAGTDRCSCHTLSAGSSSSIGSAVAACARDECSEGNRGVDMNTHGRPSLLWWLRCVCVCVCVCGSGVGQCGCGCSSSGLIPTISYQLAEQQQR